MNHEHGDIFVIFLETDDDVSRYNKLSQEIAMRNPEKAKEYLRFINPRSQWYDPLSWKVMKNSLAEGHAGIIEMLFE